MSDIKIVLADAHKEQMQNNDVAKELKDVQAFFQDKHFLFKEGTVNFVILRGIYRHLERVLTIAGVFVNKTGKSIKGLKGNLKFDLKEKGNTKFPGIEFDFPQSFLGKLENNAGFIIHINVPVEGLNKEKKVYDATELTGAVEDVEVVFDHNEIA
ncbi:hypothetical protein ACFO4N_16610 [Camelliibacillus cellulosilyticus]|uniref:Uncharacterized protein n=1 Tax=Camelliibacillus cellulosilyticus TaxID=2174486 RepID=A0ABV9GTU5_9BACL